MRTTFTFQEVKRKQTISYKCRGCEKHKKKVIEESETVSPFNKNDDGSIKTPEQVSNSVMEKLCKAVSEFERDSICRQCEIDGAGADDWSATFREV